MNSTSAALTVRSLASKRSLFAAAAVFALLAGCSDRRDGGNDGGVIVTPAPTPTPSPTPTPTPSPTGFLGAVYVGTNRTDANTIAAFGRAANGMLTPIAEYQTGGRGGVFAGPGNLTDPLISEDSVLAVDNRYVLAVNAGSNTVSVLRINADFSLTMVGTAPSGGTGPNSIAYRNGLVYVTNVDVDGVFTGPPDQSGNVTAFRLDLTSGALTPIAGSTRALGVRPSDVEVSNEGRSIVVSGVNAGSAALAGRSTAQLTSFGIASDGNLSASSTGTTASTLPGNAAGRNLPTSIGFEIVELGGEQVVVVSEAREFLPDGTFAGLATFQTGSASSWRLNASGTFTALSLDVPTGPVPTGGPTSACWVVVSPDRSTFWTASASGAATSSFRLNPTGTIALLNGRAASGVAAVPNSPDMNAGADGFIEIAISADGRFVYQLSGAQAAVNVYQVGADGSSLTRTQRTIGLLPMRNTQGMVTVERRTG